MLEHLRIFLALAVVLVVVPASAGIDVHEFKDEQQEADYQQLVSELRCVQCQNQNIADSNAGIAKDLRNQVYEQLQAGKTPEEITDFMVARYGDFVLYKPRMKWQTAALWVGPPILLIIMIVIARQLLKANPVRANAPKADQLARAKALLGADDKP